MTLEELREKLEALYDEGVSCENEGCRVDYKKGYDTFFDERRKKMIEEIVEEFEALECTLEDEEDAHAETLEMLPTKASPSEALNFAPIREDYDSGGGWGVTEYHVACGSYSEKKDALRECNRLNALFIPRK